MSAPERSFDGRLSYIDWMRGLAILIMIEAHVLDAWTRPARGRARRRRAGRCPGDAARPVRVVDWRLAAGPAVVPAPDAGSYLPSLSADSQFWTNSPMFFLLRVGLVTSTLSILYFYERRPRLLGPAWRWGSPLVERA